MIQLVNEDPTWMKRMYFLKMETEAYLPQSLIDHKMQLLQERLAEQDRKLVVKYRNPEQQQLFEVLKAREMEENLGKTWDQGKVSEIVPGKPVRYQQ